MRQQETALLFATITITTALILVTSILTSSASAYLKIFSPKQGQQVPAGSFLPVIGTSTPSNATHTKCNVQLQTNQHGYKPVQPLGPGGTYTNWKGTTSEPVKSSSQFHRNTNQFRYSSNTHISALGCSNNNSYID
ncbi:MAG: hypothetical protein FIO02_04810 [Nitrosopumilales archaeon]|nr:hypothetical protein [Nitrosopumilales archaeon]